MTTLTTRRDEIAFEPLRRLQPNRLLLRCPDITLKGQNLKFFSQTMVDTVTHRLRGFGLDWRTRYAPGRVYVDLPGARPDQVEALLGAFSRLPGIDSVAPVLWLRPAATKQHTDQPDFDRVENAMLRMARAYYTPSATFAVRSRRVDKTLPVTSHQLEVDMGAKIIAGSEWERVDLTRPDRTFQIDVFPDGICLYAEQVPGVGGLPVGSGGRVLALLSVGIDSPVSTFLLAKRGCQVDMLHMTASHRPAQDNSDEPILQLARQLSRYTLRSRLFSFPYTHFDLRLPGNGNGYELILFRRFLMRSAERLASQIGAQALVTGDSLGQVASQTLENMVTASGAVEIPIFRPLIGANKLETIRTAKRLETFDLSIKPHKDCCALLSQSPKTRTDLADVEKQERTLIPDYEELLQATFHDAAWRSFDCGEAVGGWRSLSELGQRR